MQELIVMLWVCLIVYFYGKGDEGFMAAPKITFWGCLGTGVIILLLRD